MKRKARDGGMKTLQLGQLGGCKEAREKVLRLLRIPLLDLLTVRLIALRREARNA